MQTEKRLNVARAKTLRPLSEGELNRVSGGTRPSDHIFNGQSVENDHNPTNPGSEGYFPRFLSSKASPSNGRWIIS